MCQTCNRLFYFSMEPGPSVCVSQMLNWGCGNDYLLRTRTSIITASLVIDIYTVVVSA
jgi:hypothetical protein